MKALVNFVRIIVGLLFLFSGFVKMVDPLGFSYKLEEYFGPAVFGLDFLVPYALLFSVVIVVFEFILGITLLLGYAMNFTRWALLLMMIFFTFLTFYSAYFNKVTDCGCFGDAIPLNPWQSFYKDVILSILVILIFVKHDLIKPILSQAASKWAVFIVFILCMGLTYQVLTHLPIIDFRAYKIGNNLPEKMISHGEELPPIMDFFIYNDEGEEITDEILALDKLLIIVSNNMATSNDKGWPPVAEAVKEAEAKGYTVIGLTAALDKDIERVQNEFDLDFKFYDMDETTSKAIIRSNPGLLTLRKGTVTQKVNWRDINKLKF